MCDAVHFCRLHGSLDACVRNTDVSQNEMESHFNGNTNVCMMLCLLMYYAMLSRFSLEAFYGF